MNNKLVIVIVIIIIFLLFFPFPSSAIDNGYARTVYNIRGIQDYDLHWNDRFPQGSVIKIYTEADGINHRREVAVDYVFIIKDPNNNIVDTATYRDRFHDYRENDFATYSKNVPADWEDGVYIADIYIFDLLNDSVMDQHYINVTTRSLNGSSKPDIPVISRDDILNMSESEKSKHLLNITKTFYIDKYASKYPMDWFRVENIIVDMKSAMPNMPVHVSATAVNTFYENGSTNVSLLLDNILIDSKTIEIKGSSSQQIAFEVSSEIEGNHTIEIIPTGSNTIGLNLLTGFTVSTEENVNVSTTFVYKDLQIDNLSVEPNKPVNISITIENRGKKGSQPVELLINDVLEETRDVNLNFSDIKDIEFNITKAELGAYRVTVGGTNISKVFFVESATVTPTEIQGGAQELILKKERKPELNLVLGLSILVIIIYALRLYMKKKMK